jgi:hypothetical protein
MFEMIFYKMKISFSKNVNQKKYSINGFSIGVIAEIFLYIAANCNLL